MLLSAFPNSLPNMFCILALLFDAQESVASGVLRGGSLFWHRDVGIYMLMLTFELLGGAAMEEEVEVGIKLSAQAMVHPQLLTSQELLICFSDDAGQSPPGELQAWIWDCRCGQPTCGCVAPQGRRAQLLPLFLCWVH